MSWEEPRGLRYGRCLWLGVVFVTVGLCDGFLFHFSPDLRSGLAAAPLLLAVLLASLRALRELRKGDLSWGGLPLAAVGCGLVLMTPPGASAIGIAGVALVSLGLAKTIGGRCGPGQAAEFAGVAVAVMVFALVVTGRGQDPFRSLLERPAQAVSAVGGRLTGHELHLGPTPLGLDGALLAALLVGAIATANPRRRGLWLAGGGLTLLVVMVAVHAVGFAVWVASRRQFTNEGFEEGPVWFQSLVFLWLGLGTLLICTAWLSRPIPRSPRRVRPGWLLGGAGAALVLVATADLANGVEGGSRILLLRRAESVEPPERNGTNPILGYHEREGFEALARLLRSSRFDVREQSSAALTNESLEQADLVVYMHALKPRSEDHSRLRDFIRGGGGVLIIGDHTPSPEGLNQLNEFLEPFGIVYQWDSAFPHGMPLQRGGRGDGTTLARSLWQCPEDNYGVGASMRVTGGASSVLESRWAVGDRGAESTPSLVGNRHYEHGDRLGDLPVVARSEWGSGVVLVVGDTGVFADSAVPFTYPFVISLVETALAGSGSIPSQALPWLMLLGLLLASLASRWSPGAAVVPVALALALSTWFSSPGLPRLKSEEKLVAIDLSGGALAVTRARGPQAIKGLANLCFEEGYLPLVTDDLDFALEQGPDLLVLPARAVALTTEERRRLQDRVAGGARLWLVVGFEEVEGLRELVRECGFAISDLPLGGSQHRADSNRPETRDRELRTIEAWAVESADPAEVLHRSYGYPVVVRRRIGTGEVVLFADSHFMSDGNLRGGRSAVPSNVEFVRGLLDGD